jgi:Spy/CpxP family protein refolding chaperone
MKTTLLAIAVAAVVATVLSFGAARWFAGMHKAPPAIPTVNDVEWLKRELSLNESQVGELRKYEAGFQEKFNALCLAHCDARLALGDELAKSPPNPTTARACVDRMNTAQGEVERVTLEHILKVRSVLTDEQAQRYGKLVRDQVCSMLPAGML